MDLCKIPRLFSPLWYSNNQQVPSNRYIQLQIYSNTKYEVANSFNVNSWPYILYQLLAINNKNCTGIKYEPNPLTSIFPRTMGPIADGGPYQSRNQWQVGTGLVGNNNVLGEIAYRAPFDNVCQSQDNHICRKKWAHLVKNISQMSPTNTKSLSHHHDNPTKRSL